MPTLARPEVDVLDGLTTAIIVDQQRMGADPRSTVGTATDANAMLRILFSRLGQSPVASGMRPYGGTSRFQVKRITTSSSTLAPQCSPSTKR
jgi:excinuclease UvrABC ATPase subunit